MSPTTSTGTVREWHPDQGWGVIDSDDTPGGCWAHWSVVLVDGYRELRAGQAVTFDYEVVAQDGHAYPATEVWPTGETPVRSDPAARSSAYDSSLTLDED